MIPEPLQLRDFGLEPGVSALGRPANPLEALDRSEVSEQKLGVYGLRVAHSIHAAVHVHDVLVLEAPHHVRHGVALPDVREKLVPKPSPALAPRTSPAMSTKSTVAGTTFLLPMTSASAGRRPSGTTATPRFGSIVVNG